MLLADLVVVTMAEAESTWEQTHDAVRALVPAEIEVVPTVLRPRPMTDVRGRKVAYFCTAPPSAVDVLVEHLADEHGVDVVHVSGNLADRAALKVELETVEADVFLVELKAAAVDVVAEAGVARGADVVLAANDVVPLPGYADLDEILLEMARIRL